MNVLPVLDLLSAPMMRVLAKQRELSRPHKARQGASETAKAAVVAPVLKTDPVTGTRRFVFQDQAHFASFLAATAEHYEDECRYWNQESAPVGRVQDVVVPTGPPCELAAAHPGLHLRIYYPQTLTRAAVCPWIFFIHGGGYIVGSVNTHDHICRQLCADSGLPVVSIDYTLSPAARFPQPLEEIDTALQFLALHATEYGLDERCFALAGDSAGATLALTTQLRLHRALAKPTATANTCPNSSTNSTPTHSHPGVGPCGEPVAASLSPARVLLLFYGDFGLRDSVSRRLLGGEWDWMGPEHFELYQRAYLRSEADLTDPDFNLLQNDLSQVLVPTYLCSTNLDPLDDDSLLLQRICEATNIPVLHDRYEGLLHAFLNFRRLLPEAGQAIQKAADFATQYLHSSVTSPASAGH